MSEPLPAATGPRWSFQRFGRLGALEVHDLLKLRQDIFVVEQDCAFHEIDGNDPRAWHLLGHDDDGRLVAAARVFEPGVLAEEVVIGRVVVALDLRGHGTGRALMLEAMRRARSLAPASPLRVAAQSHLEDFYASLGFEPVGRPYIEDEILHLDMIAP